MKTKLLFLATLFVTISFLKASAQTTQYVWDYVNTLQNEWLQKICTQGLDTVYIVGRNGLIAKSVDRALTWNKQYPVTTQLNDVIFCNQTTGFAVGNKGTILKTADAGISWELMNTGITVNLNAIDAIGADNIWAVGDSGKVVYSTNAGVNWQKKDFSTLANLNDISFRNNIGYIVGNAHTCFFSSDKGNNWAFKDIAIENPSADFLLSVNQTQNHTCILIGEYDFDGNTINVGNNTFIHPTNKLGNSISSFVMKNDSIGYGFIAAYLTGGGGSIILVPRININNLNDHSIDQSLSNLASDYDDENSDINFVNDSIEYILSGPSLFHLKRYIPIDPNELVNVVNKKLSVENNPTELTIRFEDVKVEKIELYSITGLRILFENIHANETSKSVNIENLSKGTYIIRAYNRDHTFTNIKWIKQ